MVPSPPSQAGCCRQGAEQRHWAAAHRQFLWIRICFPSEFATLLLFNMLRCPECGIAFLERTKRPRLRPITFYTIQRRRPKSTSVRKTSPLCRMIVLYKELKEFNRYNRPSAVGGDFSLKSGHFYRSAFNWEQPYTIEKKLSCVCVNFSIRAGSS